MNKIYKYNYLYRIDNTINSKFYYGVRSCNCEPENDLYMGSGKLLHKAYSKYGIENFRKIIIELKDSRREILDVEASVVTIGLVKDPMCYNIAVGGDSFAISMVSVVLDDGKFMMIPKSEFDTKNYHGSSYKTVKVFDKMTSEFKRVKVDEYYSNRLVRYINAFQVKSDMSIILYDKHEKVSIPTDVNDPRIFNESRYSLKVSERFGESMTGRIWINNGIDEKFINESDIDNHPGFNKGRIASRLSGKKRTGKTYMNNGSSVIMVDNNDIPEFLSNGWKVGKLPQVSSIKGCVHMSKGNHRIYVSKNDIDKFIESGYVLGWRENVNYKGKISVTDETNTKYVHPDDLEYYLSKGWRIGRHKSDKRVKTFVNDGVKEYRINPNELNSYLDKGYIKGRLSSGKLSVYNSDEIIKIDKSELDKYLELGYKRGYPNRNRIRVVKDSESKLIDRDELPKYESLGYTKYIRKQNSK